MNIRKTAVRLMALALCAAFAADAVAESPETPVRDRLRLNNEGIMVDFDPYGINMTVDGIPFSRHSQFHVKKSNWVDQFFSYELLRPEEETSVSKDRKKMTTRMIGTKSKYFDGIQAVELLPGRKMRFTVEGDATSDTMGVLQIFPFSAEPEWFAGRPYKAVMDDGTTTEGILSKQPLAKEQPIVLVRNFKEMDIDSSLGSVKIRNTGDLPIVFGDMRGRKIDNRMKFMAGLLGHQVQFPAKFKLGMEVEFGKLREPAKYEMTASKPVEVSDAITATTDTDHIIPTPKNVKWGAPGQVLRLPNETLMDIEGDVTPEEREAIGKIMDNLIDVMQARMDEYVLRCGPGGKVFFKLNKDLPTDKYDYYRVKVDTNRALLEAPTTSGLVCAAATYRQLVRYEDKAVRCAEVEDWASMPMRGIHCFSGHGENARDLQKAFIRNIMGELKINTMLYECSYINWASRDKKFHCPQFGMDLKYAKDVIAAAAKEFVEIIPMVNTMGHAEWLLKYSEMKHLADDPEHPYAYDATNPEVYKICEQIYDECIKLFKPRAVHIGHDEVNLFNVYPMRPKGKELGETKLVLQDIEHWHKFLNKYGVQTWMWQDMLFNRSEVKGPANAATVEEAKIRREGVSKDIVVVDWNYDDMPAEKFTGIETLSKEGFDNATATWYDLGNITNFAAATANNVKAPKGKGKTLGMIHTTWAGYTFDRDSYTTERVQYASYVWAAEQMWTGGQSKWGKEMKSTYKTLTRLMGEETLPNKTTAGFYIPLTTPKGAPGTQQLGIAQAVRGTERADRLRVDTQNDGIIIAGRIVEETDRGNRGVTKLTCPVGKPVSQLCFIGAATAAGDIGDVVANITVTYADGKKIKVPVRMKYEIVGMDDIGDYPGLTQIQQGFRADGTVLNLHSFNWKSPKAGTVKDITIESANHASGWYLRGIVGLNETE